MKDSASTAYEKLVVELIQQNMEGMSGIDIIEIAHNRKMKGLSGYTHQLDVVFRIRMWISELLFVVECKNYTHRVGVDELLEFRSRLDDVRAHKGVFFTTMGFQKGAKEFAASNRIALIELIGNKYEIVMFSMAPPEIDARSKARRKMVRILTECFSDSGSVIHSIDLLENCVFVNRGDCGVRLVDHLPFSLKPPGGDKCSIEDAMENPSSRWERRAVTLSMDRGRFVSPSDLLQNLIIDEVLAAGS